MICTKMRMKKRTKECTKCRDFKPLDEFDRDDKICEECLDDMEEEEKRLEQLKAEKEAKEKIKTKTCTACKKDLPLLEFGFDNKTNKIKDICKDCEDIDSKICTKCNRNKLIKFFPVDPKTGKRNDICRICGAEKEINKIKSKFCSQCNTEKPVSEFYMKKGRDGTKLSDFMMPCKKCKDKKAKEYRDKRNKNESKTYPIEKNLQPRESTEKRAFELLNDNTTFFKRQKITIKLLIKKFGFAKSTATNYMNELVNKGFLKEQGRGNGRSWIYVENKADSMTAAEKIIEDATMENDIEFEGPENMPVETEAKVSSKCVYPKPKLPTPMSKREIEEEITVDLQVYQDKIDKLENELEEERLVSEACREQETIHFENWKRELAKRNVLEQQIENEKTESGQPKESADIMNLAVPLEGSVQRIIKVADLAFSGAEEIVIYPQTHEINIKMKG